jgi:hypothetical protein
LLRASIPTLNNDFLFSSVYKTNILVVDHVSKDFTQQHIIIDTATTLAANIKGHNEYKGKRGRDHVHAE